MPDSFRGIILGLGGFAPKNDSAMYICFGNLPSMGIPIALGRVFNKVGVYLVGNAIHVPYEQRGQLTALY